MTGLPGFPPYSYYYCKYESFTCTVKDTDEKVYIVEGLEWAQPLGTEPWREAVLATENKEGRWCE